MEHSVNLLLERQSRLIELTTDLKQGIDRLLNPPKPEYVSTKQACMMLDRSHTVVLRYVRDFGIKANKVGKTKAYRYEDIKAIADKLGITLKPLA